MHSVANLKRSAGVHRENTSKRINLDERSIQDLDDCLIEFDCNPFSPSEKLRTLLHSGELASADLQNDFSSAYADGEKQFQDYLNKRIFSRIEPFDATIHRNNRNNFLSPVVSTMNVAKPTKSAAMENEAMSKVVSICCQENISLSDIMRYRLTEECLYEWLLGKNSKVENEGVT